MKIEFDVQSVGSGLRAGDAAPVCDACGHHLSSHDAIAKRYCQASRTHALTRVCACAISSGVAETEDEGGGGAVRRSEAPMYGRGRLSRT